MWRTTKNVHRLGILGCRGFSSQSENLPESARVVIAGEFQIYYDLAHLLTQNLSSRLWRCSKFSGLSPLKEWLEGHPHFGAEFHQVWHFTLLHWAHWALQTGGHAKGHHGIS